MKEVTFIEKILVRLLALMFMLFGPLIIPLVMIATKSTTCVDGRSMIVGYYSDLWELMKEAHL